MQHETRNVLPGSRFVRAASLAAIVAITALTPVLAHHSFAGYDKARRVTVSGTVRQWQFTNPHSWLQLVVAENGRQVEYAIEGSSVNTLIRRGWTRTTFRPGDRITVVMYPLQSGGRGGALLLARFADGRTVSSGITPN
jgi:hypothetical protein